MPVGIVALDILCQVKAVLLVVPLSMSVMKCCACVYMNRLLVNKQFAICIFTALQVPVFLCYFQCLFDMQAVWYFL